MERAKVNIHGIVQGVGFRPFIHKLVREYRLSGFIKNTSSGVELELEGEREELSRFVADIPARAPKLALIERVETSYSPELKHFQGFEIRKSRTEELRNTLISPDIGICDDCRRELLDPADRRYRYPFINCTNCGPRFTIIKDLPYDRARTSMSGFPMCPDCDREYHDIEDRRYHAQPDCCPVCGPRVFYLDAEGKEVPGDAIELARAALKEGKIIAVKGLGGMHLACRCDDPAIARTLRRRKQRDEKPFAVMCRDTACARKLCFVSEEEAKVLESFHKPIVLLRKRAPGLEHLSENGYLGVMLPYTPLHILLLGTDIDALVMTSANLSDTPIMFKNDEALEKLRGIADGFLLHDREIQTRCDDSLCWVLGGKEYFARRSRGYVPFPLQMGRALRPILACGAEQKASFSLSRESSVFSSQHIGDLKNIETYEHYASQIRHFERLFDIRPALLVCDKHPDYLSTAYALERGEAEGIPVLPVQHHHAHMAACMADNGLTRPVIGLVWDGTGYGDNGTTWGGECLTGDFRGYERFGSIRPIPLIGGDRATKELDRVAFALLKESGLDTSAIPGAALYEKMLAGGLNCPESSGMGRLFDGVAALLGIKSLASYEGQGAVLLEAAAAETEGEYPIVLTGEPLRFDWRPMIRAIAAERDALVPTAEIAGRFHNTLIAMAVRLCLAAREKTKICDVALSGGTFQNMILMHKLPAALEKEGFRVWRHQRVSANDEGLSLGQLMIAEAYLEETDHVFGGPAETD
ncbi:MAG: carbamoyltransferase HypF [Oscillospiraceae bacterium]|nr:carbamoyltransferase HypF [Oscillospiraceae bacterium]